MVSSGEQLTGINIYFRVDASTQIGAGHVARCLTLAEQFREAGAEVTFLCREFPGNLCNIIAENGFTIFRLPYDGTREHTLATSTWLGVTWQEDARETLQKIVQTNRQCWLVIDHYAVDEKWETVLRSYVKKIIVIDDLADRKHDCDFLLDQNYCNNLETRYCGLVPLECVLLLGPQYALLRREFMSARDRLDRKFRKIDRILVFYGGSDPTGETVKALQAIRQLGHSDVRYDIVVGEGNSRKAEIEALCAAQPHTNYYCQISNMAELMAKAGCSLGAGGAATWERCFLGLPVMATAVAENQCEVLQTLSDEGIIKYLGWHEAVTEGHMVNALKELLANPDYVRVMSQKSQEIMSFGQSGKPIDIIAVFLSDLPK